jgi:hypothetical protein
VSGRRRPYRTLPPQPGKDIGGQARNAAAGHPRPGPDEVAIVGPDDVTSFAALQDALSKGGSADLSYFVSDLLDLDGLDPTKPKPPNRLMLSGLCASRPPAMGRWRRTMAAVTSRDGNHASMFT